MKKISLLALMIIGVNLSFAQDSDTKTEKIGDAHVSNFRDWAVGVSFGSNISAGDLSTFNFNSDEVYHGFDYGIGLHVTKYLSSVWGIKGQATYGSISGANGAESPATVIRFENTPYFDYNLNAVVNLSALALKGKQHERKFSALISAGLGMSQSQQTRFVDDFPTAIYAQGVSPDADNQWTNEVFMPADLILKFKVGQAFDIDAGAQMKYYFSDLIDALPSGRSNDVVIYPHVGLTYNFGNKDKGSVIYSNPLDDMYFDVAEVKENFEQLTTDDDGDGVSNYFDKDNSTPEGVAVTGSGEAMDTDEDGIPDNMDEDPFTSKGAKVDAQGRAIDSDNDGVPDYKDKEANTPKGSLVNFQGVNLSKSMGGSAYMPSVYFSFNSAKVSTANEERLATIAIAMKNNSDVSIKLVGHADSRGTEKYNMELARRRAEAVKSKLVQIFELDEARISVEAAGEGQPLAKPEANYSINRRVDVIIQE